MDRKYYYAFYSYGVNVEGEPAILNIMTVSSYPTVIRSYLVKDYKNEEKIKIEDIQDMIEELLKKYKLEDCDLLEELKKADLM